MTNLNKITSTKRAITSLKLYRW